MCAVFFKKSQLTFDTTVMSEENSITTSQNPTRHIHSVCFVCFNSPSVQCTTILNLIHTFEELGKKQMFGILGNVHISSLTAGRIIRSPFSWMYSKYGKTIWSITYSGWLALLAQKLEEGDNSSVISISFV